MEKKGHLEIGSAWVVLSTSRTTLSSLTSQTLFLLDILVCFLFFRTVVRKMTFCMTYVTVNIIHISGEPSTTTSTKTSSTRIKRSPLTSRINDAVKIWICLNKFTYIWICLLKSFSKDFSLPTFALTDLTPDSSYSKVSFGFTNVIFEPSKASYSVARAIVPSKD